VVAWLSPFTRRMMTSVDLHSSLARLQLILEESQSVNAALVGLAGDVQRAARLVHDCLDAGGCLLLCGNGGSAADAQHLAAEFVGRFKAIRKALPAVALPSNACITTAVGNDSSFDEIFSRQVEAFGHERDVLLAFSTSGNSANVVSAAKCAKQMRLSVVGFTGEDKGFLAPWCDILLAVPSSNTPRIQEAHITLGHALCELVEMWY
jgi:D-sedoheptulose 7-phosphate isomerase